MWDKPRASAMSPVLGVLGILGVLTRPARGVGVADMAHAGSVFSVTMALPACRTISRSAQLKLTGRPAE
jgi:hypothetical protein